MTLSIDVGAFKSFLSAAAEFVKRFNLDDVIALQPNGDNLIYASMDPSHIMLLVLKMKFPPVLKQSTGLNAKEALMLLKDLEGDRDVKVMNDQDVPKALIIGDRKVPLINVTQEFDPSLMNRLEFHYLNELATAEISFQEFEKMMDILKYFDSVVFKAYRHENCKWDVFKIEADNDHEKYIKELLSGKIEKGGNKGIVKARYRTQYLRIAEKVLGHVAKGRKHLADIKIAFATGKLLQLDLEPYLVKATIYIAPRAEQTR